MRPVVIPVVHTPDSKWDGVGKGINRNAARVEAGGAGALNMSVVQLEKSPKSSSGESCQIDCDRNRALRGSDARREIRIWPKRLRGANRDTKIITGQFSEGGRSTGKHKRYVGGAVTRIDGGRKN